MTFIHKLIPFILVPILFATAISQAQELKSSSFSAVWISTNHTGNMPTNHAPTIGGKPKLRIVEGQAYWFRPWAKDAEGDALTFSIANRPSWAIFNHQNGTLRGTPRSGDDGSYNNIVISVSDGSKRTSLKSFNLVVAAKPINHAPVIGGTPKLRIEEEQAYWFRPWAKDADGNALTFSIANRPSWATFDRQNGTLRGTPRDGDDGSYNNIVISVSDGSKRTSLKPFNLVVAAKPQAPSTGNIRLSWVAPSTRTDGSALPMREIAGYRIYRGTSSNNLQPVVDLNDGYINNYVMRNQTSGTYHFAVTAYDNNGNESNLSNIVQKRTM